MCVGKTLPSLRFIEMTYLEWIEHNYYRQHYIQKVPSFTLCVFVCVEQGPQGQPVVLILLKFLWWFVLSCRVWDLEEQRNKWENRRRLDLRPPGLGLSRHTPHCSYDKWHPGFSSVLSLSVTHRNIRLGSPLLFSAGISAALGFISIFARIDHAPLHNWLHSIIISHVSTCSWSKK